MSDTLVFHRLKAIIADHARKQVPLSGIREVLMQEGASIVQRLGLPDIDPATSKRFYPDDQTVQRIIRKTHAESRLHLHQAAK